MNTPKTSNERLSRREFLTVAAGSAIGLLLAACKEKVAAKVAEEVKPQQEAAPEVPLIESRGMPMELPEPDRNAVQKESISPKEVEAIASQIHPPVKPLLDQLEISEQGILSPDSERRLLQALAERFQCQITDFKKQPVRLNTTHLLDGPAILKLRPTDAFAYTYYGLPAFELHVTHVEGSGPDGYLNVYNYRALAFRPGDPTEADAQESLTVVHSRQGGKLGLVQRQHQVADLKGAGLVWERQTFSGEVASHPGKNVLTQTSVELLFDSTGKQFSGGTHIVMKDSSGRAICVRDEKNNISYADDRARSVIDAYGKEM